MLAWNVEPCAANVPLAHGGALPAAAGALDAAAVVAGAAGADVAAVVAAGAEVVGELVVFLLLLHAADANNTPAVSRVAAMRVVLTGKLLLCRSTEPTASIRGQRRAGSATGNSASRDRK